MKKLLVVLFAFLSVQILVGCMNECTCVVKQEFVSSGQYTVAIDTTVVPSKLDCSIMNQDTIYYSYDTTGAVVTDHYIANHTICY